MTHNDVEKLSTAVAKATGVGHEDADDFLDMMQNPHFRETILECWRIYNRKGNDYTRGLGDLDRTDNFKKAAENNGITPLQAWGTYFYKHESAVWRYVKEGFVESEGITSRVHDIINYAILLLLLVKEKENAQASS